MAPRLPGRGPGTLEMSPARVGGPFGLLTTSAPGPTAVVWPPLAAPPRASVPSVAVATPRGTWYEMFWRLQGLLPHSGGGYADGKQLLYGQEHGPAAERRHALPCDR